jgi:hypothetical protein
MLFNSDTMKLDGQRTLVVIWVTCCVEASIDSTALPDFAAKNH